MRQAQLVRLCPLHERSLKHQGGRLHRKEGEPVGDPLPSCIVEDEGVPDA